MRRHRTILLAFVAALTAAVARADFQVTGTFQYEKRLQEYTTQVAQPCWTGTVTHPIRYAVVRVLDATNDQVLLEGATDDAGNFTGTVPTSGRSTVSVFVRCYAHVSPGRFGTARFHVTDPGGVEYAVKSPLYRSWNSQQPLALGTITALGVNVSGLVDHPFNDYDNLVWMLSYFESYSGFHPTVPLAVAWPYVSQGCTWDGDTVKMGFFKGDNDSIELHEMGHYLTFSYCGGFFGLSADHSLDQTNQDPRVSCSEGVASLISGLIRKYRGDPDPGFYAYCEGIASGALSQGGFRYEDGDGGTGFEHAYGPASEGAVIFSLWDLCDTRTTDDGDDVDDDPIDGSFLFRGILTGEQLLWTSMLALPQSSYVTFERIWNGFFSPTDWGHHQELQDTLVPWGMRYENDAWEPDNTPATATPLPMGSWSPVHTLYFSSSRAGAPGNGDSDYFSFSPVAGRTTHVRTTYPHDACAEAYTDVDPYLVLRNRSGTIVAAADGGGDCGTYGDIPDRNAGLDFVPTGGVYTVEVKTVNPYRRTGAYQVKWYQ